MVPRWCHMPFVEGSYTYVNMRVLQTIHSLNMNPCMQEYEPVHVRTQTRVCKNEIHG